jgi:hypothetical protein
MHAYKIHLSSSWERGGGGGMKFKYWQQNSSSKVTKYFFFLFQYIITRITNGNDNRTVLPQTWIPGGVSIVSNRHRVDEYGAELLTNVNAK